MVVVAITIIGEIQVVFGFFLDWLLLKDLNAFIVGWHDSRRNLNTKEKWLLIINKWML